MTVQLPDWQAFSTGASVWTPDSSGPGRVVAVFAPGAQHRDGWSSRLTVDLVEEWATAGNRVVLADCVLEHPTLHRDVGIGNEEGVSDAALFGASVGRVARPAPDRSFFFLSAGTPVADPESVAVSPRWVRLQQGFRDVGATLVVFLRAGSAGVAHFLDQADDVIVLAGQDGPDVVLEMGVDKVRAHLGPDGREGGAGSPAETPDPEAVPAGLGGLAARAASGDWIDAGDAPQDATVPEAAWPEEASPTQADTEAEAVMRFGGSTTEDVPAPATEAASAVGQVPPDAPGTPTPPAASPPRPAGRKPAGADPKARQKLLWVFLGLIVLVAIVLMGVLRSG